jgi:hypothetical protein
MRCHREVIPVKKKKNYPIVHVTDIPAKKFPNLNLRGCVTAALAGESAARCRGRASWRLPPPMTAPAAALLKHCMLDLYC